MAIIYDITLRNNRLQQVVNAIDGGPGSGLLKIGTAGMGLVLITIPLVKPCASVAAGVLSFLGLPITAPAAFTGIAVAAVITDSTGFQWVTGLTVSSISGDIIINTTNITGGANISFIAGTITGN